MPDNVQFKIGDSVSWTKLTRGYCVPKTGVICEIVPPRQRPAKFTGNSLLRDHLSFAVKAGNKTYWPGVRGLKLVKGDS